MQYTPYAYRADIKGQSNIRGMNVEIRKQIQPLRHPPAYSIVTFSLGPLLV